jgi:hypothetical protein
MKRMVSGGSAPGIFKLATRWRWVVNLTPWPLYPRGKGSRYPLDMRLGGASQSVRTVWSREGCVSIVKWDAGKVMVKCGCTSSWHYLFHYCYFLVYSIIIFININLFNCSCNCICIVFIVCSVSYIVCVVLCAVFCLSVVRYFVWCVLFVRCVLL